MDLKTFELFARYNVWSTQKLNQVLKNVSDEDFNAECGLFFKSISGTLNHFEPYRVCRRVNILRDYPDDKIKIYP